MSSGPAKAWVRRLDNSFFRDLTGGLPWLTTDLERGSDGIVHFTNLQLYSPKLRLSGSGERLKDGTFHIVASGRQAKYGPLRMVLDGHIERPRVDLLLASPNEAMGIKAMHLLLDPTAVGFNYRASGGSKLGPFTSAGQILLPKNGADDDRHRLARCRRRPCQRQPALRSRRLQRPADARERDVRRNARLLARCRGRSGSKRT